MSLDRSPSLAPFDASAAAAASTPVEPASPLREGLPSSFRMRHNAHYVEEMEARSRRAALGLTSATRGPRPTDDVATEAVLQALTRHLQVVSSCLNLVAIDEGASAPREREGLELARIEARRAERLSEHLRLLVAAPTLQRQSVNLTDLLERLSCRMAPEFQLSRVEFSCEAIDPGLLVYGDAALLATAVTATLGGWLAVLERARPSDLRMTAQRRGATANVRLTAHTARVIEQARRLLDLEWPDHPGGLSSAAALAAARRAFQWHDGDQEIRSSSGDHSTGTRLVATLTLPLMLS